MYWTHRVRILCSSAETARSGVALRRLVATSLHHSSNCRSEADWTSTLWFDRRPNFSVGSELTVSRPIRFSTASCW